MQRVLILFFILCPFIFTGCGIGKTTYFTPSVLRPVDELVLANHATSTPAVLRKITESPIPKASRLPMPLKRTALTSPESPLTSVGILSYTNKERTKAGRSVFTANPVLRQAAEQKLADMFAQQYFDHETPEGTNIEELMVNVGYSYITIGENLALGHYVNDADLVRALMQSLGHRENILSGAFTEIGIAVEKSSYRGKTTWMAVQEFGKPLDACPAVSETFLTHIEATERQVKILESELEFREQELAQPLDITSRASVDAYNQKVEAFNSLREQYLVITKTLTTWVDAYNMEVETFRACSEQPVE